MRVVPRKVRPFVPGTRGRIDSRWRPRRNHEHHGSAQPDRGQAPGRRAPTPCSCGRPGTPTSRRRSAPSCASTTAVRPTSSSRSKVASGSAATASWASGRAACSRSAASGPRSRSGRSASTGSTPDLPIETLDSADPLSTLRTFLPRRRVLPARGHAPVHRRRGRRARLRRRQRLRAERAPARQPIPSACPTAAFIETDLVIVFDHLTHTISAIASLHTEVPDLDARYRIAERAIFEALDRTVPPVGRPSCAGRPRARPGRDRRGDRSARRRQGDRDQPRPRPVHPRRRGRQGRDRRRRGDPGRPCPAPVVRPAGRRRTVGRSTGSACTAPCAGSTRARTCSSSGRPRSRSSGASPELLLQVEGDRLTTHPIAGTRPRGADGRRGRPAQRGAPARPEGEGRARDARRPRP